MTATHVNGVPVIASEPALSTWRNRRTGEPLEYRQMLRLLLEDGSEVYGCLHCDYTHPNLASVRPHLNKHRGERINGSAAVLAEVGRQLQDYARVVDERDQWRTRALKAEGDLRRLRTLLGVKP